MVNSPQNRIILDEQKYYEELAQRKGLTLVGSYNPADFDLGETAFSDGSHPTQEAVRKLFAARLPGEGVTASAKIDPPDRVELVGVDNPNSLEVVNKKPFFWIGSGDTCLIVRSPRKGTMRISFHAEPGPSLPTTPVRNLALKTTAGFTKSVVLKEYPNVEIAVPINQGRNEICLTPLDKPTVLSRSPCFSKSPPPLRGFLLKINRHRYVAQTSPSGRRPTVEEGPMSETGNRATAQGGLFEWYDELAPVGKRTFWASAFGWGLDGFDVQIYGLALAAIATTLALTSTQSGWIATATLFTSAFGGWIAGLMADRIGRVRMLQIAVAWFALFTFLCAFAQNFWQFFAFRALMGFGFGGEWAAGAVLMGEVISPRHRGKAVGVVQGAWAVGWAVAVFASTLLFNTLSAETAWRVLFMLGILPALLIFYIWRFVEEPPVFKADPAESGERGPSFEFPRDLLALDDRDHGAGVRPHHRRAVRLLRDRDVGAKVPRRRAQDHDLRLGRIPLRAHHRLVHRLYRRRLFGRSHRPPRQFHFVRGRIVHRHGPLHPDPVEQRGRCSSSAFPSAFSPREFFPAWGRS